MVVDISGTEDYNTTLTITAVKADKLRPLKYLWCRRKKMMMQEGGIGLWGGIANIIRWDEGNSRTMAGSGWSR